MHRARQLVLVEAARLGQGDVHGQHDPGARVDGHAHRDLFQIDPVEERGHVVDGIDGHALAADFAERARVVGVVAHQRGHVEVDREPGLAVLDQIAKALVGVLAGAEAGDLPHGPEAAAIHRRIRAAGIRILSG